MRRLFSTLWFVLGLLPPILLIAPIIGAGVVVFFGYRRQPWSRAVLLPIVVMQLGIAMMWTLKLTATTAFHAFFFRSFDAPVLDPGVEKGIMKLFWIVTGLLVLIFAVLSTKRVLKQLPSTDRLGRAVRIVSFALVLFLLMCIHFSWSNGSRVGPGLAEGISPDGQREVLLVPMDSFVDMNGLVLWRRPGEFWWHSTAKIGDVLTGTDVAEFVWDADSARVVLVCDGRDYVEIVFLGDDQTTSR